MPKKRFTSRKTRGYTPLNMDRLTSVPRVEVGLDGRESTVRHVRGSDKTYRCPGCDHLIGPHTAHVVAWANDDIMGPGAGLEGRRHWHSSCWQARERRGPQRRR